MHELSLVQQIANAVLLEAEKNGIRQVEEVVINYNPLESFDIEILLEHLELFKPNSALEKTSFHFIPNDTDGYVIAALKGEK